jgi:hypothetical protein
MTRPELEERLANWAAGKDCYTIARAIAPLVEACQAGIAYDKAIKRCANDPSKMASYCTAQGDDLDDLYLTWIIKCREALRELVHTETGKEVCQTPNAERNTSGKTNL